MRIGTLAVMPSGRAGGTRRLAAGVARTLLLAALILAADGAFALKLTVDLKGIKHKEHLANVQALLGIYQERADPDLAPARVLALHRMAADQIRDALAPFGFYRVQVTEAIQEPPDPKGNWVASYRIDPGEAIKIGSVDYQVTGDGAGNPAFPKPFPLRTGDVLLHAAYEKAKSDLRYAASSAGFLDYQLVQHQVLIDPVAYQAHVLVHLETGPQYRIGPVSFKQDLLDEEFLAKYVTFKSGDVYDPDTLLGLQGRLLGTEYYDNVEIVPLKDRAGADHQVPIEVVAHRNNPNKYRIGFGFATDAGPRVTLDYRRRYIGRQGHKFRTQLSLAPALSRWELDYRIPIQDPTRDYIIIKPQSTNYATETRSGWLHSIQAAHSTLTPGGWRRNIGLDYRYEDFDLNDLSVGASNELVPNISWSKTVSDDPVNTSNGYRIKYTVLGALQGVVSQATYLSGQMEFKWVRRFANRYRFIARTDLGATLADSVDDLPAGRRFYAGGDNSIRGWGFDTLGPNDPETDDTVGGRYLAVGSLELERQIKGPWSAAVFTDFGNAFDPDYEQQFAQSAGLGLRWASPIGQIRFDVAFALTKDPGNEDGGIPPARLHIVIGPDL